VYARVARASVGSFLSSRDTRSGGSAASGGQASFREGPDSLLCIMADISVPLSSSGTLLRRCLPVRHLGTLPFTFLSDESTSYGGTGGGVRLSARDCIDRAAFHRRRSFASLLVVLSCLRSRWTEDRDG